MPLDKQIHLYEVDTGNFYSNRERYLHWLNHKLRNERLELKNKQKIIKKELNNNGISSEQLGVILKSIEEAEDNYLEYNLNEYNLNLVFDYFKLENLIKIKKEKINNSKERLLTLLKNKVEQNIKQNGKHHIRELNPNTLTENNIISVFDSNSTRIIGCKPFEFTDNFIIIQVYYFSIIKDLIYYGFMYKGEKYIYFTSSAGQIRTKKTVFVKESVWKKNEKTLMCGLDMNIINQKGGSNPNKYLSYMALNSSATDVWDNFDIDKTIVIDDFETQVFGTYDFIDDKTYDIQRQSGFVPITHTDGSGMILPNAFGEEQRNKMVRLSWIKGLLGVFDFKKFIEVHNCSPIIKDIYGLEHNVLEEDIQVIFTKSQFKFYKYYNSWQEYKDNFKKFNCKAGFTNEEEKHIKNTVLSYQMLQSLIDITDKEIKTLTKKSYDKLNNICNSKEGIFELLGITPSNRYKTSFQKSVELYPDLLNDEFVRLKVKEVKDSLRKKYKSGKIEIYGKYTFILPDFYAACQHWFLNQENPDGLLKDGEVYCNLFYNTKKLDCLRSPHLYKEHAVRINKAYRYNSNYEKIKEWFKTKAVYTSCKDLISKILQFDTDGDTSLVVADETFVDIAERNMDNVVPLYYEMKKAQSCELNSESLYDGLEHAFTGSNIGQYSNNISKIWNNEVFINGTDEEKEEAIKTIKLLCCENNYKIDYAKCLYMPERPPHIKELILKYTKSKLPHFFVYAKNKDESQVEQANASLVNKFESIFNDVKIRYKKKLNLKEINISYLMNDSNIKVDYIVDCNGKIDKDRTNPIILKYCELSQKYKMKLKNANQKIQDSRFNGKLCSKQETIFGQICNEIKFELLQCGYTEIEISDILVKYLYEIKQSVNKDILWLCYGNYIYNNLLKHIAITSKEVECRDCGILFKTNLKNQNGHRCPECSISYRRYYKALKERDRRIRIKNKNVDKPT